MKTVSVVIPSYNREKYISQAIQSVLDQKLPKQWEMEVIVADDGSSDNTLEILKTYKNKIKILRLKHSGKPAVPRNEAIKVSKGELIAFQDSDDLWAPNKLINQLRLFDNPNTVLSFGQAEVMDSDGEKSGKFVVDNKKLHKPISFSNLLEENTISTLTVIAKKEALLSVGGFNEENKFRAVEDYQLWLKLAAKFPNGLISTNEVLALYRVHDNNISKASNLIALRKIIDVIESVRELDYIDTLHKVKIEKRLVTLEQYWSLQANADLAQPKITVLMSVFNGEKFLKPAIESILKQTFKNFEFLIINDGSTDKTRLILEKYQTKDNRIRIVNQDNHGFIYSLRKGVEIARSEFIARMDADDISLPKRLEEQLKLLEGNQRIGAASTYFEHINFRDGKPLGILTTPPPNSIDLKRALYFLNPMAHGATTFRKQAYEEVGGYTKDYAPAEDYDLWRRIAKKWELGMVPKILFQYRVNNPASMSQANTTVQENNAERIRRELLSEGIIAKNLFRIIFDYLSISYEEFRKLKPVVRNEYVNHQYSLARIALESSSPLKALSPFLFIIIFKPRYSPKLFKKYPRAISRNIRNRLK